MLHLRKANERGVNKIDWLEARHSFSFGHYYDPKYMGFGNLVVINDDIIKGGGGFPEHSHNNMEIVTYVISGELAHKDSLGNVATIKAGEVQRMSAGSGIRHSEFNYSKTEACRLLQIWFLPAEKNIEAGYEQKQFSKEDKKNNLKLLVSPKGENGSLRIFQDVEVYGSILEKDKTLNHKLEQRKSQLTRLCEISSRNARAESSSLHLVNENLSADMTTKLSAEVELGEVSYRYAWIQIANGNIEVNGQKLETGDGLAIEDEAEINIKGLGTESEFVIFSMGK